MHVPLVVRSRPVVNTNQFIVLLDQIIVLCEQCLVLLSQTIQLRLADEAIVIALKTIEADRIVPYNFFAVTET